MKPGITLQHDISDDLTLDGKSLILHPYSSTVGMKMRERNEIEYISILS